MTSRVWLDGDLVQTLSHNFDELNGICQQTETGALHVYEAFALARQEYEQQVMTV